MGLKRTDEFRKDAVRIALSSGLTRKQVANDLGVGMSTLNKWITTHRDTDVVSKEDLGLAQENDRLRRENRKPKAKSSAGTKPSRTASCWKTTSYPAISKPRSRPSSIIPTISATTRA